MTRIYLNRLGLFWGIVLSLSVSVFMGSSGMSQKKNSFCFSEQIEHRQCSRYDHGAVESTNKEPNCSEWIMSCNYKAVRDNKETCMCNYGGKTWTIRRNSNRGKSLPTPRGILVVVILVGVSFLVLMTIIGVVVWCVWRSKHTVFREQRRNKNAIECVESAGNSNVPQTVMGDSYEYAYVDDLWQREPAPLPTSHADEGLGGRSEGTLPVDFGPECTHGANNGSQQPKSNPKHFVLENNVDENAGDGYQSLLSCGDDTSATDSSAPKGISTGYEVSILGATTVDVPSSGGASSYDHLGRLSVGKRSLEGAPSKLNEHDHYHHLVQKEEFVD